MSINWRSDKGKDDEPKEGLVRGNSFDPKGSTAVMAEVPRTYP